MAVVSLSPNSRIRSRLAILLAAGGGGSCALTTGDAIATGGTISVDTGPCEIEHEFTSAGTFALDSAFAGIPVTVTITGTATFGSLSSSGSAYVTKDVDVTVTSGSVVVAYDPADLSDIDAISGIELILEPDRESAYSDGDTLTTLNDQSGNARNFTNDNGTPTWEEDVVNGRAVVRFGSTESLVAGSNFASGFTSGETFIVAKADADPAATVNAGPFIAQGQTSTGSHVPWSDGNVYDSWGSTARKTVGNPTPSLASWRYINVRSASGAWTWHLDGTQIFTTGTNTVGFSHAPRMAYTNHGSGRSWPGDVAFVLMTSAILSTDDRATIVTYIQGAFGL